MARKIHPKFFGKIINGKLVFDSIERRSFDGYISTFREDQEVEVVVKNKYKKRTSGKPDELTNFNGYYWGVIIAILMDHFSNQFTKNEVHNWLQEKVENTIIMPDGRTVIKGTENMSGGEFADYCSKCRMFCAIPGEDGICEEGLYIPEPNEVEYDQ